MGFMTMKRAWLALFLSMTFGVCFAQEPSMSLSVDKTACVFGDSLTVSALFSGGAENRFADAYAAVMLPDGSILMWPGLTLYPPLASPWKSGVSLAAGQSFSEDLPLFPLALVSSLPKGDYTFLGALARPGTQNFIGSISSASFNLRRGYADTAAGDLYVDVYDPDRFYSGTTFFAGLSDSGDPKIVEVDMAGEVVWYYALPAEQRPHTQPGMDVEVLANGNILYVAPGYGIFEITREKEVVWSHLDDRVSHDADRLENGNTLYVYGDNDTKADAQAKEVDAAGNLVWSWSAASYFNVEPYASQAFDQGWTHANAVTRLENGNTLINLRNFDTTVEVNPAGDVVWSFDWSTISGYDPHEPEVQEDGNILIGLQKNTPHQVVELNPATGEIVWEYYLENLRTVRDADRLPNGNILVVGVMTDTDDAVVFEVTPDKQIVWQLKYKDTPVGTLPGWFYKAQRM